MMTILERTSASCLQAIAFLNGTVVTFETLKAILDNKTLHLLLLLFLLCGPVCSTVTFVRF